MSVGPPLTMIATAPCRTATGTRPAAGKTARVEPTASSRSQLAAASSGPEQVLGHQALAEADGGRLEDAAADGPVPVPDHRRAGRVGLARPHPVVHRLGRLAVAATQAHHLEGRAVDLDDAPRVAAGLLVQPVDVLRDQQVQPPAALQVDQRRDAPRSARPTTGVRSGGSATHAPAARGPRRRPGTSPSSRPRGSWSRRPGVRGSRRCPSPSRYRRPVSTTTRLACSSSERARPMSPPPS